MQLVGLRECFAHEHFAAAARRQPVARAQEEPVQFGRAKIRERMHLAARGLIQAGQIEGYLN